MEFEYNPALMIFNPSKSLRIAAALALALALISFPAAKAMSQMPVEPLFEEEIPEESGAEDEQMPDEDAEAPGYGMGQPAARPSVPELEDVMRGFERSEAGAEERRWSVKINAAVRANYVFNDSADSFVIKYTFEVEGDANADTAVIRGDANITADVEGNLARWPTGQCSLAVSIPKVPFEITFRKGSDDKGSVALQFRRPIMEDWKSSCSFTDAPGARFETSGPPEKWLAVAIEKARPPIRSIVTDIADEETTTSFVITKQVIDDAPLGSVEVEGTGVVTITPGG
ncbi:MAG: hypothetical protein JXA24_08145 [Proteobacteria bacterium]|nr:hypothetical protein [Pseudomonadota bacterium]